MTTTLAGIVFDTEPIITRPEKHCTTVNTMFPGPPMYRTCGIGTNCVNILTFSTKTGGLSGATLKKLIALSEINAPLFLFSRNGKEILVSFRREAPGGAIQMHPCLPVSKIHNDMVFFGQIQLFQRNPAAHRAFRAYKHQSYIPPVKPRGTGKKTIPLPFSTS
jgi:hypothetical protein